MSSKITALESGGWDSSYSEDYWNMLSVVDLKNGKGQVCN